jgi:putative FmdB family regulatory protein
MPIYEYRCQACDAAHEAIQKTTDAPLVDCPECGKPELRKQVSAPAFRLKGSGWYETDFKTGNKKNLAGESGKESTPKSESAKAESKPAAGKSSDSKSSAA